MKKRYSHYRYKADSRKESELINDLDRGLKNESIAIRTFHSILLETKLETPEIVYVGSEKEGSVIKDSHSSVADVGLFPDYLLKYKQNRRIKFNFIEVKICNPHSEWVYFKERQLKQYQDLGSTVILSVMGFSTEHPKFILIKPEDILALNITPQTIYNKPTIVMPSSAFSWEAFSVKDRKHMNILAKQFLIKEEQENAHSVCI